MEELMPIGHLAKKLGVSTRTIRYYEDIGLIKSIRHKSSNYRLYDREALERLEQILLFRDLKLPLCEIIEILAADNNESVVRFFSEKLVGLEQNIRELSFYRDIIGTFLKISEEKGTANINIYELLKAQVYVHQENERMITVENKYRDGFIRVEFGTGIIPMADMAQGGDMIDRIKALKVELERELGVALPLIRLRDNERLGHMQYVISIYDRAVFEEELVLSSSTEGAAVIVAKLGEQIKKHINQINI